MTDALTVLIVDDDPMALQLLSAVLSTSGVTSIITACDGEDAIAKLEATEQSPALVISDIDMPKMDGWSLARRLRMGAVEAYKTVPIFMLTANNSDQNQQKASYHKINGYMVKPPTMEAVAEVLASVR